jgi:hypothetical protein
MEPYLISWLKDVLYFFTHFSFISLLEKLSEKLSKIYAA